jgi:flagellar biosynthetic protein FliS|tara:strand:- start:456 stop:893 length:438 start_codon:yes stop_codon:yes gene_type:complete
MKNNEYIKAYKKTQQSANSITSSYEIIRSLIKELMNSMQKIALDIQDERDSVNKSLFTDKSSIKDNASKKAKNISKSLSIIYGLQTCLDFDKAPDIATNLFQLYEFCRQEIIKGFSQKNDSGIIKAIGIIKQILEGWEEMPSLIK